jgi:hypothetical protein
MLRNYGLSKNGIYDFGLVGFKFFGGIHVIPNLGDLIYFGELVNVANNKLYNQIPFTTDYLEVTGEPGSYLFRCPDTEIWRNADTDYIWFKTNGIRRWVTEAELTGHDLPRTPIYYDNLTPHSLKAIGVLNSTTVLNSSRIDSYTTSFKLSLFWNGIGNRLGQTKGNRVEQRLWIPEPLVPTELVLTLVSGGVQIDFTDNTGNVANTEVWSRSDDGISELLYTLDPGVVIKIDLLDAVDARFYKLRAKNGSVYSEFTEEVSIEMTGPELIDQENWATVGYWPDAFATPPYTADGSKINSDGTVAQGWTNKRYFFTAGKFKVAANHTRTSGEGRIRVWDGTTAPWDAYASGTYVGYLTSLGGDGWLAITEYSYVGMLNWISIRKVLMP